MSRGATSEAVDVPAVMLGGGITALAVVRNLGRRGIPLYSISHSPEVILRRSRWYRPPPAINGRTWSPAHLPELLAALPLERAVLIPCADDWQLAVARLPAGLLERFPTSSPSPEAVLTLVDKGQLSAALSKHGVPQPRTLHVGTPRDLDGIEDSQFTGAFLKPRDSQRFQRVFDVKGFHCRGRADALERLQRIHAAGLEVLLQEYIPGPPTAHYFIDGFIDRAGRVCARFTRRRLRMFPPDFGNSTLMESVPVSEVRQAAADLDRLLAALEYRGVFSAEFKRDERDGVFRLLEVNCRHWWYAGFAAQCGVDVTLMAYRDALGLPVQPVHDYETGARCVYPYYDRHACRLLYQQRMLGPWGWARSWIGASQPILCWDDPMPSLADAWEILATHAWRRRRRA